MSGETRETSKSTMLVMGCAVLMIAGGVAVALYGMPPGALQSLAAAAPPAAAANNVASSSAPALDAAASACLQMVETTIAAGGRTVDAALGANIVHLCQAPSRPTDLKSLVTLWRDGFKTSCVKKARNSWADQGKAMTTAARDGMDDICACTADQMMQDLTPADVSDLLVASANGSSSPALKNHMADMANRSAAQCAHLPSS